MKVKNNTVCMFLQYLCSTCIRTLCSNSGMKSILENIKKRTAKFELRSGNYHKYLDTTCESKEQIY